MKCILRKKIYQLYLVQESQIFRANNSATKFLAAFAESMSKSLLKYLLQSFFSDIQSWPTIELDPLKFDKQMPEKLAQDLVEGSRRWIQEKCGRLLQRFLDCASPGRESPLSPGLRYLLGLLQAAIVERFVPENGGSKVHSAVVGFLFLRIICPTICSPEKHSDLLPTTPLQDPNDPDAPPKMVPISIQPNHRRALILMSKLLQNLANGLLFGAKESYLISCNPFIEKYKEPLYSAVEAILKLEFHPSDFTAIVNSLPEPKGREIHNNALLLFNTLKLQLDKLLSRLSQIHVNEVVTYTVYGALKSVINR